MKSRSGPDRQLPQGCVKPNHVDPHGISTCVKSIHVDPHDLELVFPPDCPGRRPINPQFTSIHLHRLSQAHPSRDIHGQNSTGQLLSATASCSLTNVVMSSLYSSSTPSYDGEGQAKIPIKMLLELERKATLWDGSQGTSSKFASFRLPLG